jgi:type III restriction enzyme
MTMSDLLSVMNEIFGINKFVANIIWQKRTSRENRGALSNIDRTTMQLAAPKAAAAIEALVHKTRGARLAARPVAATTPNFIVPRLAVRREGNLELFDRTHFLDIPWKLEECDCAPVLQRFAALSRAAEEARVDVSKAGKVIVNFVTSLQDQLVLTLEERGRTKPALVNWIDRRLPQNARTDITRTSSALFIGKVLDALAGQGTSLDVAARGKYRLVGGRMCLNGTSAAGGDSAPLRLPMTQTTALQSRI